MTPLYGVQSFCFVGRVKEKEKKDELRHREQRNAVPVCTSLLYTLQISPYCVFCGSCKGSQTGFFLVY